MSEADDRNTALAAATMVVARGASTGVACLTLGFGRWAVLVGAGMAFALGLTFGPKMLRLK